MNCIAMERTDCECPCECHLQPDLCAADVTRADDSNEHLLPACVAAEEELEIAHALEEQQKQLPVCFESKCEERTSKRFVYKKNESSKTKTQQRADSSEVTYLRDYFAARVRACSVVRGVS